MKFSPSKDILKACNLYSDLLNFKRPIFLLFHQNMYFLTIFPHQ
jgi:hypothetical protein